MKMKRNVKGFTLIELIVVMALFTILIGGAYMVMGPVTDMFSKSANYEACRAETNIIKNTLEGNLAYADAMWVYNGFNALPQDTPNGLVFNEDGAMSLFSKAMNCDKNDVYIIGIDNANGGIVSYTKGIDGASPQNRANVIGESFYENRHFEIITTVDDANQGSYSMAIDIEAFNYKLKKDGTESTTATNIRSRAAFGLMNINKAGTLGPPRLRVIEPAAGEEGLNTYFVFLKPKIVP